MRIEENINRNIIEITKASQMFPEALRQIKDCPEKLFCIGDLSLLQQRAVAVVGSRRTTQYGRNTARSIGQKLAARGIVVVSGMAAGIDACAHEGAVKENGRTIAVLGCGPDICYPTNNYHLKTVIETKGLVISEYPPGTGAKRYHFPQRNRIISGLSDATVVVQAGVRSGSMITAELAMEQGREVFAVPGNIDSQYNLGSNKLIRDGAVPVLTVGDLLDNLGLATISEEEAGRILSKTERHIYNSLRRQGEMTVDELCLEIHGKPSEVTKVLTIMELKGILFQDMGKIFIAK